MLRDRVSMCPCRVKTKPDVDGVKGEDIYELRVLRSFIWISTVQVFLNTRRETDRKIENVLLDETYDLH